MFVVRQKLLMMNKIMVYASLNRCREFSSYKTSDNYEGHPNKSYKSIADFYAGKSVFITGATGFLGKVVIEKLLYSCKDIEKIYILVRRKKNDNINTRLQKMFDNTLFDRLKEENPVALNKIVPIEGDLETLSLGINNRNQETLKHNVSVVIHAGASVKFNDSLKVAMNINFNGTQKVLELSKQMKNIEVVIEKLLYSCKDIEKIYILVRRKKNDNINTRLQKMFDNTLFDRLKEENPVALNKIVPIEGDLETLSLGINNRNQETLKHNVSVVIHAGASVKFNDSLKVAMNINFNGTQKVLELSKQMKNIEAFIYVSTAFSQSTKKVLEETVYPAPAEVDDICRFIKDYENIEKDMKRFLNGRPNTYVFSKAMCENFIANNCGHVPTIMIRPAIVTAIKDGPVVGWLDNWAGITGTLDNMAKGWNRITLGKGHYITDMIPVDYVANLTIAAAAKFDRSKKVSVYNSCSSDTNPITWAETYALFIEEGKNHGYNHIPFPFTLYSNSKMMVKWLTMLLQHTPAFVADLGLKITGRKPKYQDIQNHVVRIRDIIEYFTSHSWTFKSDKARDLYNTLSSEDQQLFPFDPAHIDWKTYVPVYCTGIQQHLYCKVDKLLKE